MIKPTIGRVVWFWPSNAPSEGESMVCHDAEQPMSAQVIFVWSDCCVNLYVIDHAGVGRALTSVALVQANEPKPEDGRYCEWMPYQMGQAKKEAST